VRRSALVAAALAFLGLVAGGVGARALLEPGAQPPPSRAAQVPSGQAGPGPSASAAPSASSLPEAARKSAKKLERPLQAGAGRLELAVAPWGEVLVDGKSRGVSPPLRALDLPPGAHTIELRNSTFPAHVERVELKAGEAVRIKHRFR